jgi:F0F1-type ATP synthase epsilon subunit
MQFQLITLHGIKLDKEVYELVMPTAAGEIGVFPGHEHLVSVAIPGAIAIRHKKGDADKDLEYFAISGGIIVDEAESGEDIVEAESKAALDKALQLHNTSKSQVELENAKQLIDRHTVRLKVADLHRRRRSQ